MYLKSAFIHPFANYTARHIDYWSAKPYSAQEMVFRHILHGGRNTAFGKEHNFGAIRTYQDFKSAVPVRDYEQLKPYIERIIAGEHDVLWPGIPRYFAKTSGTTSGPKYIPVTTASLPNHFGTARNALFNHYAKSGRGDWLNGKMIFLSGSPKPAKQLGGIPAGRLSGIINGLVPFWLRSNQMPSYAVNCITDWEEKVSRIVDETLGQDMRLISGIPSWVLMYYEYLLARSGKQTVREVFPHLSMFVYGGVNFEPYRAKFEALTGGYVDTVELYAASEGFVAFQDRPGIPGMLLNVLSGIFYEFVPAEEIYHANPTRLSLAEVEPGVNYALIINNNAGLWGYNIGDTIVFESVSPPRLKVSGRVQHYISAFGEHVIGKEVEEAIQVAAEARNIRIVEFTVAPQINPPEGGLPYHEWWVEFDNPPADLTGFAAAVDAEMQHQNIYYQDFLEAKVLRPCVIRSLPAGAFRAYMKAQGKLGDQNKVPRLSNDRTIVDALADMTRVKA